MLRLADLAFISGIVGFFGLALLLFVPQMFQQPKLPTPMINKLDVSCWTPDQFTTSHIQYANEICQQNLLNNKSFSLNQLEIQGNTNREIINIFEDIKVTEIEEPWRKEQVAILIIFEILAVCGFYVFISIVREGESALCRIVQAVGHVAGIVFVLLASFIPYISLAKEPSTSPQPQPPHSGGFLCDFSIRSLGSVQRYTVQCAYSFEIPLPQSDADQGINAFLILNGIVCGAVVILGIGSLLSMFTSEKKHADIM